MQRKKNTEDQIIPVLREGEAGAPVDELCRPVPAGVVASHLSKK